MRTAAAFAPAHITGFFVPQPAPHPLEAGSLGAGVNLELGITSYVRAMPGEGKITWLGMAAAEGRQVSHQVAQEFYPRAWNLDLELAQDQVFPAGHGLGSSGAGALSMALAVNAALGFPLSPVGAAMLAHRVEVENRTGLGTVLGQTAGGIEVRTQAGAPGIGKVLSLGSPAEVWVHLALWEKIDTAAALDHPDLQSGYREVGERCLNNLLQRRDWQTFQRESHAFTRALNIGSDTVRAFGEVLENRGRVWAMPLFGQGVFWLSAQADHEMVQELHGFQPQPAYFWMGRPSAQGAHLV